MMNRADKNDLESEIGRILIVDDDEGVSRSISMVFRKKGYQTDIALNGGTAISKVREVSFDAVLLDLKLPDMDGLEVLPRLKAIQPDMSTVMMTAYASVDSAVRALTSGASAFVMKPLDMTDVLSVVKEALAKQRLTRENRMAEQALLQKGESLRLISSYVESTHDALICKDMDGIILSWNMGAQKMYGYTAGEILGRPLSILVPHGKTDEFKGIMASIRRGEPIEQYESERKTKDGRIISVSLSVSPLRDEAGELIGALSIARDITERRRSEEVLRERTQDLDCFFNVALDMLCIADTQGRFRRLNLAWEKTLGYSREELTAGQFFDFIHPDDIESTKEAVDVLVSQKEVINFVNRYRCKDGTYRWIEWRSAPVGEKIYAAARDITERKEAEEELEKYRDHLIVLVNSRTAELTEANERLKREVEERKRMDRDLLAQRDFLETLIDTIPAPVYYKDADGVYKGCNMQYASRIIGLPKEKIIGRTVLDLGGAVFPELAERYHAQDMDLVHIPGFKFYDEDISCPDGTLRNYVVSKTTYMDEHGHVAGLAGIMMDMTDRMRIEQNLKRSERNLAMRNRINEIFLTFTGEEIYGEILNVALEVTGSPRGFFGYVDTDTNLVFPGQAWNIMEDTLTSSDTMRIPWQDFTVSVFGPAVSQRKTFVSNQAIEVPGRHAAIDSILLVPIIFQQTLIGVLAAADKASGYGEQEKVLLENMSSHIAPILHARLQRSKEESARKKAEDEMKQLEAQFLQSQKMESIGTLAGGIAHDFNNMLAPILGYADLVLEDLNPENPCYQDVLHIRHSAERAKELTWQLLAFSRKQILEKKTIDLRDVVADMEKILRRTIREEIVIKVFPASSPNLICADVGMISQILMNLAVNSQDAMEQCGTITIETADAVLDEAYVELHPGARAGDYVMLSFSDTGKGMDRQTQERIFEPFFTTKEKGKGTGLGLATVYGIVKQHGGYIMVYSEPDKGTTFRIYLPRVSQGEAQNVDLSMEYPVVEKGTETVLLVEDEEMVREITYRILTNHGYNVIHSGCAEECLESVDRIEGPIHLLITDVVMPGMNGRQLYDCLTQRLPGLKVIFISGYTYNIIAEHGVLIEGVNMVSKPFTVRELTAKVRAVLDGREGFITPIP